MIARIYPDPWKEFVPPLIAIAATRLDTARLRGLVEMQFLPNRVQMRVVGSGCEASLSIPAQVKKECRIVVSDVPISMITRAVEKAIDVLADGDRVVFQTSGVEISSSIAPDVEFPPEKVAKDRAVSLGPDDVLAWSVADEPTTEANADDTIWLGVTPQNKRLYASGSSTSWSAMVRDGQDLKAVAVPATILRRIKPAVGDCIGFCQDGITVRRSMIQYAVGALSSRKIDAYPIFGNVLNRQASLIRLNEGAVKRLTEVIRVVNMGSELSKLIPVLFTYSDGFLYVASESTTISGVSCVKVRHVSGLRHWSIGIAGDSLFATLNNFRTGIDIGVTENPETGAMLVWNGKLVSARASLRVHHQLRPEDYRHLAESTGQTDPAPASPSEDLVMEEPEMSDHLPVMEEP